MKRIFTKPSAALALAAAIVTSGYLVNPTPALAQKSAAAPVSLSSEVKIERTERDASGAEKTTLHAPSEVAVVPGDKVVFTLLVNNTSAQPAIGFMATNPMPAAVRFDSVAEDWAEMSVDSGKNWGKLASLKVKIPPATGSAEGERPATAEDVTHVRWVFVDAILPGTQRTVSYRGVVK